MRIDQLHDRTQAARAESARLSVKTTELLTWAHKFLKAAGWERTCDSRQSAMFNKLYGRGQREVYFGGWHGTGAKGICRNFGDLKLIFDIGDNQPGGTGPRELYAKEQHRLDIVNGSVADAEKFMETFRNYVLSMK